MSRPRTYSDEQKAAVMAALLAGQSVSSVAREYNLPKGTVSGWKVQAAEGVAVNPTQKRALGDRLTELVERNVDALIAITGVMHDPAWLRQQSAAELGTLLGITHDKVVRMLEAMGRADGESEGEPS